MLPATRNWVKVRGLRGPLAAAGMDRRGPPSAVGFHSAPARVPNQALTDDYPKRLSSQPKYSAQPSSRWTLGRLASGAGCGGRSNFWIEQTFGHSAEDGTDSHSGRPRLTRRGGPVLAPKEWLCRSPDRAGPVRTDRQERTGRSSGLNLPGQPAVRRGGRPRRRVHHSRHPHKLLTVPGPVAASGKWKNFFLAGKYKVLEHLGTGEWDRCSCASTGTCAAGGRQDPAAHPGDPTHVERPAEAQAVAMLDHPNIVRSVRPGPGRRASLPGDGVHRRASLQYLVDSRGRLPLDRAVNYVAPRPPSASGTPMTTGWFTGT